jgi:hypothetical protein
MDEHDKAKANIEAMFKVVFYVLGEGQFTRPQLECVAEFFEARAKGARELLAKIDTGDEKPATRERRLVVVP